VHRQETVDRFRSARSDPDLAVLEGLHPLKHALRFGADVLEALSPDVAAVLALAGELAPDVRGRLEASVEEVPAALYGELAPRPPDSGVVALARRPPVDPGALLADPAEAPAVLLEAPTHLGNLGAAVRAAAAAGAAGVLATGQHDPWHASALRGSAGLHFALPVAAVPGLPETDRPLVAVDPGGEALAPASLPPRALLAFGSERRGLGEATLARAHRRVRIPMREGVSSLNLATSVAVVLYAWRLAGGAGRAG
jgi:TrmH family RNA methyltransferase